MFWPRILLAAVVLLLTTDVFAEEVYIKGGDSDALQAAIDAANSPGSDVIIHLEAGEPYHDTPQLSGFKGNLKIEGNGAVIGYPNVYQGLALGTVSSMGSVSIFNVTFEHNPTGQFDCSFIDNKGNLTLNRVAFSNTLIETNGHFVECDTEELLLNEGTAEMHNVTIVGTHVSAYQGAVIRALENSSTIIKHLTFIDSPSDSSAGAVLAAASGGSISVSNSIILSDGNTEGDLIPCAGHIIDNGGNFASAGDCGFSGGLIDRSSLGPVVEKGHDSWVVPLAANSIAIDAGNPEFCEKLDGRGFERDAHCDSGAYEAGASNHGGELGRGGVSGIYYTPDGDGNYVQLQRVYDGNVVIIWNAFDKEGNQAWVFGLGSYEGGSVTAKAYRNIGGVLQPGGGATAATVTEWGTLKVTVHDCLNITVDYDSADTNFGAGSFDAQRLAYVHDLGCSE